METTKQITKRILKIAFPMAGARIINMISIFVGMVMVSRLGHDVLAASALITASYYTVVVIFMFVLFSVGVVVGRNYGAKKFTEIGDIVQQSALLALLLAIPLILLFWYFGRILTHFGQDPKLVVYVARYFHALVWMAVPMLLFTCMSQFMFAVSKILNVVIASVLGVTCFMFVAYALIFGHWGAPACGISGFAYAILVQDSVSLLYLLAAYALQKDMHVYGLFKLKRTRDWTLIKTLWRVGWPMSIQFGGELIGFFVITILIGLLSINDLAAWQVVQQIMMVFIVPIFSFAEAAAIVVGHSMGAKEYVNINKVNRISTGGALIFVVIGMLVFILLPTHLTHIYMSQQNLAYQKSLQHVISTLFFINAFVYLFDSVRNLMSGSLRGLYDTRFPMVSGIVVVWVIGVGMGYVLAFETPLGIYGFSIAQSIAFLLGAIAVVWRWRWQMTALPN
ncbi:MAG: MATE family efflux transporter [Coxiella sp. (in: Bacteria)]|nr:MAG: MATE family efflux transporter [Coxiella sp. (in: g-proteobacteria)]